MNNARTQITTVLALGAALAMPLAFAQSAVTPEIREAQEAATDAAAAAQDAAGTEARAQAAGSSAPPAARQLGWSDVDADGNGTISQDESVALPALAAVFAEADADGDGELTQDEYRAHAGKGGNEG